MRNDPEAMMIAQVRQDFAAMAAGWRAVAATSAPRARQAAEVQVFNQMVVALHGRLAGAQVWGALEVQLLAEGVQGNGRFAVSGQWRADQSVTGYRAGDRIALSEVVFSRLAGVVLDGLARQSV